MRYIAHRANRNGPDPSKENTIEAIAKCLGDGLDVEIDVRLHADGKLYLGHDDIQEEIVVEAMLDSRVWVHAKTPETLAMLARHEGINCFYQDEDNISLTTRGYFWCHSRHPLYSPKSVLTILDMKGQVPLDVYAVCTDYPIVMFDTTLHSKRPRIILLDIDGVMTNGRKIYDRDGRIMAKEFCDRDFTAIKRFQASGVKVIFMSGDEIINRQMASSRGVQFMYNPPGVNKHTLLTNVMGQNPSVSIGQIVYVGDDYYDLMIMEKITQTYCPADATSDVKSVAKHVLHSRGGEGVVAELYDRLRHLLPEVYPADSPEVNPS